MSEKDPVEFEHTGSFTFSHRAVTAEEMIVEGSKMQRKLFDIFEGAPVPVIMEALMQSLSMMVVQCGPLNAEAVMARSRLAVNNLCALINQHFKVMEAKAIADREINKAVAKTVRPKSEGNSK